MRISCLGNKKVSVVRIKRVEFRTIYGLSPGTKRTVRNNEVSVLSGCP